MMSRGGGEVLLALVGGVDQYSDKGEVVECARLVLDMEGEKMDCMQRQGMTPLMWASREGCKVRVAWLVEQGAHLDSLPVQQRQAGGWSPMCRRS